MVKREEISSTEKLLKLIRTTKETDPKQDKAVPEPSPAQPSVSSRPRIFKFGKSVTVGVDISYHDLKLVKTQQAADKKYQLLDYKTIPFEAGVGMESPRFVAFLKAALNNFRASTKHFSVWCSMSSARVETRCLRIPKVQKKQINNILIG